VACRVKYQDQKEGKPFGGSNLNGSIYGNAFRDCHICLDAWICWGAEYSLHDVSKFLRTVMRQLVAQLATRSFS